MQNLKDHGSHIAILVTLFVGLLCLFLSNPSRTNFRPLFPFQGHLNGQSSKNHVTTSNGDLPKNGDPLDVALAVAATTNRTVIIAIVNKAYVEGDKPMLDIFLDSFWAGEGTRDLINHLLLVAMDQVAYDRCKFLHLHCYKLQTDGVNFSGEELYMSEDFIRMMWRRTSFLGDVLKRGYNFIFTDSDVMWLRNPFLRLNLTDNIDFQISTDTFNGQEWSESNPINTGFYMIMSNNKTISLFDSWYARKNTSTGLKEQDVLDKMMHEGMFRKLQIKVRFLDTLYFSGFCQDSKDIQVVTTVHANCCRTISAKIKDLMNVLHDWKRFKSSATNHTSIFGWSRHDNCIASWN